MSTSTDVKKILKSKDYKKLIDSIEKRNKIDLGILRITQRLKIYSPFEKGQGILYKRSPMQLECNHGIIRKVDWNMPNGIHGFWELLVEPTDRHFNPFKGTRNNYVLAEGAIIEKIIKLNRAG